MKTRKKAEMQIIIDDIEQLQQKEKSELNYLKSNLSILENELKHNNKDLLLFEKVIKSKEENLSVLEYAKTKIESKKENELLKKNNYRK
ncbi:MAG: hypothetical protein ISQ99_02695 [Flavobacteriales bacterium]|nr:hypothetical protein [Flavobacteriales bacterium]